MRRSYVVVFLAGTSLAGAACSLTTSLEGFSSTVVFVEADADASGAEASDGSRKGDTSTVADAGGGDDSGAPNIHPRGTFESGVCDSWTAFQGKLAQDTTARTGTGSCRVCTLTTTTDYFTADDLGAAGPAVVGATYRAEGWARSAPGAPNVGAVTFVLRNFTTAGGFKALETHGSASRPVDANWQRYETTMTITMAGGTINVIVSADHRPGACFLIDDVTLRRLN
jgi:hypothetical protein